MLFRVTAIASLAAALFGLVIVGDASAQEKRGKRDFKAFDTDNDGRISPKEWKLKAQSREIAPKELVDRFLAIDTNADGYISADEMSKWAEKKPKAKKKAKANAASEAESEKARQAEEAAKAKQAKKAKRAKKAKAN